MTASARAPVVQPLPASRPQNRRWLVAGVLIVVAIAAIAVAAIWQGVHYAGRPNNYGPFRPGIATVPGGSPAGSGSASSASWEVWLIGALLIGGVVGARYARGWWRTVAFDAIGLVTAVGLGFTPGSPDFMVLYVAWFSWVLGVGLGTGWRRVQEIRRIRAAAFSRRG